MPHGRLPSRFPVGTKFVIEAKYSGRSQVYRRHRLDAGIVQGQAVEKRAGNAVFVRVGQVVLIGGQNCRAGGAQSGRHAPQRLGFLLSRSEGERAGGRTRLAADIGHGGGEIACPFNAFQRRGHSGRQGLSTGPPSLTRLCSGGEMPV